MQNLILTLAIGDNTTLLLTERDYTIVYAVETDPVTAYEVILNNDKDYVYDNDEDGLHGSYLEENWNEFNYTLLSKHDAKEWAIQEAIQTGYVTIDTHTDNELNTVETICNLDGQEISRFSGFQDGYFFEGTITTPHNSNGHWYRGIEIEQSLLAKI